MQFTVPEPMRAIEAIRLMFPDSSRRTLQHWLMGGRFLLNGQILTKEGLALEKGQIIESVDSFHTKRAFNINILFEDRYLIAIDKPEGLLSVPLDAPSGKHNALGLLREHYQTDQIFPVHRIDRETSGILIFARGTLSQDKLDLMFENHDLEREYFAILEGRLSEEKGRWECFLKELPNFDVAISHNPEEGKKAVTYFEVMRRSAKYTYVSLSLETGRKHQIRVHCKEAGCPVLGDQRYGASEDPIRRMCLHSRRIAFKHPMTNQNLCFTSPLPFSFKKLGATDQIFSNRG